MKVENMSRRKARTFKNAVPDDKFPVLEIFAKFGRLEEINIIARSGMWPIESANMSVGRSHHEQISPSGFTLFT